MYTQKSTIAHRTLAVTNQITVFNTAVPPTTMCTAAVETFAVINLLHVQSKEYYSQYPIRSLYLILPQVYSKEQHYNQYVPPTTTCTAAAAFG